MVAVNMVLRVKKVSDNVLGFEIELPNAPPLIVLRGSRGFVMCGYLDIGVAEKLGLLCARVSGVSSVEEMLDKEVAEATAEAVRQGIKPGVRVRDILKLI